MVTTLEQVPNPRVSTGLTSTALDRAPGPSRNFVRGKSGYVPFLPGGLDILKPSNDVIDLPEGSARLRTVAPGLSRGLRLHGDGVGDADSDMVDLSGRGRLAAVEEDGLVYAFNPSCGRNQLTLPLCSEGTVIWLSRRGDGRHQSTRRRGH